MGFVCEWHTFIIFFPALLDRNLHVHVWYTTTSLVVVIVRGTRNRNSPTDDAAKSDSGLQQLAELGLASYFVEQLGVRDPRRVIGWP